MQTSRAQWLGAVAAAWAASACFDLEVPRPDDGDVVLPVDDILGDVGPTPDTADSGDGNAFDSGSDALADTDGSATDAGDPRDIVPAAPTLDELVAELIVPHCSPCHTDRVSGTLWLSPRPELAAALLAPATQLPAMARVTPGSPDESYLWLKVTGAHLAVGGLGEPMPLGEPLDREALDLLRRWIEAGALTSDTLPPETTP